MYSISLVAAFSAVFPLAFSFPTQPPECTVTENSVSANSTHCFTAFEQLKARTTTGNSQDRYQSCHVSVIQPAEKSLDPTVLQYAFTQLIEACPYGSYALDAAATLYVAPVEDRITSLRVDKRGHSRNWFRVRALANTAGALAWNVYTTGCNNLSRWRPQFPPRATEEVTRELFFNVLARSLQPGPDTSELETGATFIVGDELWRIVGTFRFGGDLNLRTAVETLRGPNNVFNVDDFIFYAAQNFLQDLIGPTAGYQLIDIATSTTQVYLGFKVSLVGRVS